MGRKRGGIDGREEVKFNAVIKNRGDMWGWGVVEKDNRGEQRSGCKDKGKMGN